MRSKNGIMHKILVLWTLKGEILSSLQRNIQLIDSNDFILQKDFPRETSFYGNEY